MKKSRRPQYGLNPSTPMRLIMFVLVMIAPGLAAAQATGPVIEPTVVVAGDGIVHAVPDRAFITVGAESRASSAREAQRRNTELMTPILDKLRAAGVPADAIRTIGYDVQYEWDFVNNKRVGRGYVARNTVELRVDAIDRVGEFLEIAAGSGATSLGGVRFDLKNRPQLQREALKLAVEDARGKAEAVAAAAGRAVNRIVQIAEQGGGDDSPRPMLRTMAAAADAAPPVSVGQIEVTASVRMTVSLK
jgi:uncharacterized protein